MVILRRKVAGVNVKETQMWNKDIFIWKCNHMFVYDLLNNTVICSDYTVKSDRID